MPIKKLYLELTNRCNLHCVMCYRNAWNKETVDMKEDLLNRCLKQIDSISSIEEVVLGGIGEPTIFPQIEAVMKVLQDKHLTITTNGTMMHDPLVDAMVESIDHLVISLDGMDEVFYQIRKYSLGNIITNVKKVINKKEQMKRKTPYLSFQMVISKTNKQDIFKVIDLAKSIGVNQVILSNVIPTTNAEKDLILYERYQNEEMKIFFQKARYHALIKGVDLKLPTYQLKTERRCNFIDDDTTMITANGEVVPCYRLAHEGTEYVFGRKKEVFAHSFGNIMNESLDTIWNSTAYASFRKAIYNNHYPSCIDCDLVDGCDMVRSTDIDCYGTMPSCADCLWSRKITYCI
jgi:tungsten cofactor oxidoreducase radical SAM maturase